VKNEDALNAHEEVLNVLHYDCMTEEELQAALWRQVVDVAYSIVAYQLSDPRDDEPIDLKAIVEEWRERQASCMSHDEWVGAQETSIREEFPFGICPCDDHTQAIEVDVEELQMHAHEAWETLLETVMRGIRQIREDGPTGDALRRQVAEEHGVPLWCPLCGEPAEDVFSEGDPLE
jgi:hypothetical protein